MAHSSKEARVRGGNGGERDCITAAMVCTVGTDGKVHGGEEGGAEGVLFQLVWV